MGNTRLTDTTQLSSAPATVAAKLPDFWPMLGLVSTLRPVPGVNGQFQVTLPEFAPIPVPATVQVYSQGAGSAVSITIDLPDEVMDEMPYVNKVPFGKGKKMVLKAISNTLRVVNAACMKNYDAYLRDQAGQAGAPASLPGTPMTFSSATPQTFDLPYATVAAELPALFESLPVASTLVADAATPGRYTIQPGRYAVIPIQGFVQLTPSGNQTLVTFEASLALPLGELPWFVPKGAVASSLQDGFKDVLTVGLKQCEAMIVARQKGQPPPSIDGLAA